MNFDQRGLVSNSAVWSLLGGKKIEEVMMKRAAVLGRGVDTTSLLRAATLVVLTALAFSVSGCGTSTSDRALSGAGIGAGTGALVGALFGGVGAIPGALVGAGAGAATGAVVDEERINLGEAVWE